MARWLLHMSDLHLSDRGAEEVLDDDKVELPQPDLETVARVLRRTLSSLERFVALNGSPEAVVISGDLTSRADETGFQAFSDLIAEHPEIFPEDSTRVVVVPGNHDVDWSYPAGDPGRYAGFLRATRDKGFSTPPLDGVDFAPDDETGAPIGSASPHVLRTETFVVVPINSSNWCGTAASPRGGWTPEQWDAALADLDALTRENVTAELRRLTHHDIARVSRPQVAALERHLASSASSASLAADGARVRVATLHHQLLPVSTKEERKPFEALMNLGLVREILREFDIDVVLHGHKHENGIYWDATESATTSAGKRVLVISAPGRFAEGAPVLRAIEATGSSAARSLRISTFLGPRRVGQNPVIEKDPLIVPLWLEEMRGEVTPPHFVRGKDVHVAYARLQGLADLCGADPQLRNLVCQIDNPANAHTPPPEYPEGTNTEWFTEMVDWWQRPRSELVEQGVLEFNHGVRIHRQWGDQIDRAARLLRERSTSSRALVQLVGPDETGRYVGDQRDIHRGPFPAFVLAEFSLSEHGGETVLDCFGYFRKQELRYWWPVNVGELAHLQAQVRELLDEPRPSLGRIVTFSAIALWQSVLPRVAVPEIDRLVDEPERLWGLAAAVTRRAAATEQAKRDWKAVLDDLDKIGDASQALERRPRIGLEQLATQIERARGLSGKAPSAVETAVRTLDQQLKSRADKTLNSAAAGLVKRDVHSLRVAVEDVLG